MPTLALALRRIVLLIVLAAGAAHAESEGKSGGLLGIDRYDEREDRGLLSRSNQKRLDAIVFLGMAGTALWEGTDSPLGRASWQAVDATLTTAATTEVMKRVFQRPRPSQNDNPNTWFAGSGNKSFPSGETAYMAAFVTPYILSYGDEHPAAWGLLALPLYMGTARMAAQGHWLTDVLAGAAVGFGMGYLAHERKSPLVLTLTGDGVFVGWKAKF